MSRRKEHKIENGIELKHCSKCNRWHVLSNFRKCGRLWDGLGNICKSCKNTGVSRRKKYKIIDGIELKQCCECQQFKDFMSYNKDKNRWDNLKPICRDCEKNYYKNNIEEKLDQKRDYYHRNRDKIKSDVMLYYNKNKSTIRKRNRIWEKKKVKTDNSYRLSKSLRSRVKGVLKSRNIKKTEKSFDLIGCSPKFCKEYIESLFKDGMSWDNYGFYGWHIDHIVPCAAFDLTKIEEQRKCFHYTNLQPLWCADNLKKSKNKE